MGKSILVFCLLASGFVGIALGGERSARAQNNYEGTASQQVYVVPRGDQVEGQGPEYRPVDSAIEGQAPEYYTAFRQVYVQGMGVVYVPIQSIRMGQPPEY